MPRTRFREHPGEVLLFDFIKPRQLTASAVARQTGIPRRRLDQIVDGTRPLTAETSLRLGRFFGISGRFWINLQTDYEMTMASSRLGSRLASEVAVLEETR